MANSPPIQVKVKVDDCLLTMEVDTGASSSLRSEKTYKALWPGRGLQSTDVRLQSYNKDVNIEYNGQTASALPLKAEDPVY